MSTFQRPTTQNFFLTYSKYLIKIKPSLNVFVNDEHTYSGQDWNTGEKWSEDLKESIEYT